MATKQMSKFEKAFEDTYHHLHSTPEEKYRSIMRKAWNIALREFKDSLAKNMRTEYGLTIDEDRQVVDWDEIEHTLDKLKEE